VIIDGEKVLEKRGSRKCDKCLHKHHTICQSEKPSGILDSNLGDTWVESVSTLAGTWIT